jgi:hypothetical protein
MLEMVESKKYTITIGNSLLIFMPLKLNGWFGILPDIFLNGCHQKPVP